MTGISESRENRALDGCQRRSKAHARWIEARWRLRFVVLMVLAVLTGFVLLAAPVMAQDGVSHSVQEDEPDPSVYVVQQGDTLFDIAQRFGTTVDAIIAANGIEDRSLIVVGQKLVIPVDQPELAPRPRPIQSSRLHSARSGETLPALAFRYRTTVEDLKAVNESARLGVLLSGQMIDIPAPSIASGDEPAFPHVSARPAPVTQGQTMVVFLEGVGAQEIDGWFLGQRLRFHGQDGDYWALAGVDARKPPGGYPLQLTVTESGTGDLLTVQEVYTVTAGGFTEYNVVVPESRMHLLDPAVTEPEEVKVDSIFLGTSEAKLWQGLFSYPLEGETRVTAPFGQRRNYNDGVITGYHTGLDLDGEIGTPVYAPAPGIVVMAEPLQVRGQVVILDHGLGVLTGFWHLSRIDVQVGQSVSQGELVGMVGNSGRSTGSHLHWEMRVGGLPVDPVQWTRQTFP